MRWFAALSVWLGMAISSSLSAAPLGSPTDVAFTAYDGSTQYYMQLMPTDFDPKKQYDVVIALHGSGSGRTQYAYGAFDEARATRDAAANHDMIMICPDYRAKTSWMGPAAETDMVQIIASLKSQYHVGDVILTGASMGGTGSLTFTALHPGLIDGVCSVNGLANFDGYKSSNPALAGEIAASFGTAAEYAKRSAINSPQSFTMPFSVAAGGADTVVPPQSVLQLVDVVKNSNPRNPKVISFYRPTGGHSTNYVDNAVALEYVIRNAKGENTDLHPITINTSFEYQKLTAGTTTSGVIDGWTTVGTSLGVTHVSDYAAKFIDPPPDGNQMAKAKNGALYQFLGTTAAPGTYHLSVMVGTPKDAEPGSFKVGFMTAANNIASVADLIWAEDDSYLSASGANAGHWSTINVDWVVDKDSAAIGKCLYVDLWADHAKNDVYFDKVNVAFTPLPEPTTIVGLITMCVAGGALTRRRWRHGRSKIS
jgi:predicted esterase